MVLEPGRASNGEERLGQVQRERPKPRTCEMGQDEDKNNVVVSVFTASCCLVCTVTGDGVLHLDIG